MQITEKNKTSKSKGYSKLISKIILNRKENKFQAKNAAPSAFLKVCFLELLVITFFPSLINIIGYKLFEINIKQIIKNVNKKIFLNQIYYHARTNY